MTDIATAILWLAGSAFALLAALGVLRMPDVRSRLENDGASVGGPSRDRFGAAVGKEIERWGQVIRKANIQQ